MIKQKGLAFSMRKNLKEKHVNSTTVKTYKRSINKFCEFTKSCDYTNKYVIANKLEVLQHYADFLTKENYSPNTIHTYLAFPCDFFGIEMDQVKKPIRTISSITRSRGGLNVQGRKEAELAKNSRLVKFQTAVGIRREELKNLTGNNFKYDESGYACVEVMRGKGGKYHLQRIAKEDVEFIKSFFDGSTNKVFTKDEMRNKIDLHALRAANARKKYNEYNELCKNPLYREKLQQELICRFENYNKAYKKLKCDQSYLNKFIDELDGIYKTRGNVAALARSKGRPTQYDRLAIMAVSVFHLSHWRCNVIITNYMI